MLEHNTTVNVEDMNYAQQDVELEAILQAQQDRIRAEEQEELDTRIKCEAAKYAAFQKCVQHAFHIGNRVCMFLSGVSVASAVHFFNASGLVELTLSIVGAFGWIYLANCCDANYRKKPGKFLKWSNI